MAKHRIHRWFQFGVFDLLLLTLIAAIMATLCRPLQPETNQAAPWVIGYWHGEGFAELALLPDGCFYYRRALTREHVRGFRWTMTRLGGARDAFVLECNKLRLIIQSESGSDVIDVLNEDAIAKSRLYLTARLEGSWRDGAPDGTWKIVEVGGQRDIIWLLDYRHGEPVDLHLLDGRPRLRVLDELNLQRNARGLPALTDRDFPEEATTRQKSR
jgi:hypothetical protein